MAFQTGRFASVRVPSESVWRNASAESASIGRRMGLPWIFMFSISAGMQIANTAQTKVAFHHGSTVPYGIGVRTIRTTRALKISLFSKPILATKSTKLNTVISRHRHRSRNHGLLVRREDSRGRFRELAPEQIRQI